jgi:hypothetical protein
VFRLYLYDDFTKPLPLTQVRDVAARIVTRQTFDAATKTTKELAAAPLVRNGRFLEARIGKLSAAGADDGENLVQEGRSPSTSSTSRSKRSRKSRRGQRRRRPPQEPVRPRSRRCASPSLGSTSAERRRNYRDRAEPRQRAGSGADPESVPEILAQLRTRTDQIRMFIDRGSFASVYVPAFQAKDLALALDARKESIAADKRKAVQPAIAQLVRSAYLLDAFGDLGNKQQIVDAFAIFSAAVKDIQASFPEK